ncbi:hypothetical protein V8G61_07370 [Gaetbulibacter sp. M240]|uniref:hypothetical protein n=1 Tax=Gaetbulibacter sp. M240 TaxID=3126511 RepID=UPI00374F68F2
MKLISVRRKTIVEKRHTIRMGELTTKVTYIKKYLFGMPYKTLHKYRETYYGEIKDSKDCMLFV